MNDRLQPLLSFLRRAGGGSKLVALIAALAVAGVLAASGWVATRPDWSFLYADLDDAEAASVVEALAGAGVDFERGGMRAPYSIQVDAGDRSRALAAIAQAGALSQTRGGIQTESGAASIFQGSQERAQAVRKREWQEAEEMLQTLDFVYRARVGTSTPEQRIFGPRVPVTASVTLTLRGQDELTRDQAKTVSQLVRFRLGVQPEDLMISDQAGRSLWDGASEAEGSLSGEDWLDLKLRFDQLMEDRANQDLLSILGPERAHVRVNSEWDTEQRSSVSTTTDPDSAVPIYEESTTKSTPQGASPTVGGPAGSASNLEFGAENAGVAGPSSGVSSSTGAVAKDNTARTSYVIDQITQQTVKVAPVLKRLSIALFVDDEVSLDLASLERAVKAAVSWVEGRDDFQSVQLAFHVPEAVPAVEGETGRGDLVETLIGRGVELLSAVAFIFLFFKALKGLTRRREREAPEQQAEPEVEVDPIELAREQVAQIIREDPARVGQILSRWAVEDRATVGSGR